jgi:hypothetical protein
VTLRAVVILRSAIQRSRLLSFDNVVVTHAQVYQQHSYHSCFQGRHVPAWGHSQTDCRSDKRCTPWAVGILSTRKEGCVTAYNSLKMREALLPRIDAWELQGLEACIVRPDQARRYREPCRDPFPGAGLPAIWLQGEACPGFPSSRGVIPQRQRYGRGLPPPGPVADPCLAHTPTGMVRGWLASRQPPPAVGHRRAHRRPRRARDCRR